MVFENGVKNTQAAAYNGARTVNSPSKSGLKIQIIGYNGVSMVDSIYFKMGLTNDKVCFLADCSALADCEKYNFGHSHVHS